MYLVLWDQMKNEMTRTRVGTGTWKVDACPMTYYSIAPVDNGFVAAWPTRDQISFARIDRNGKLLPPGEVKTAGRSGHRTGMLALTAPGEGTLVAWKRDNRLGWQLDNALGQPAEDAGSAPSEGNGIAGVINRDGRFVLFR